MCYVDKLEDLPKLMCSKYVKANNKNTFNECKDFLNAGKLVLYSGTPCQIAALKLFLKADYNNLITVSVACFGTMPVAI
jgi:coenzyme F420-reducing hydrogenase beta subunit